MSEKQDTQIIEPFPRGTRVHHRGAIYSCGQGPEHPDGGLRGGWGAVQRSIKQSDGTYEYEVARDREITGGAYADRHLHLAWWGSHHIDRVLPPPPGSPEARGAAVRLRPSQVETLKALDPLAGRTAAVVSASIADLPVNAAEERLDRLVASGHVAYRDTGPSWDRRRLYYLTKKGRAVIGGEGE